MSGNESETPDDSTTDTDSNSDGGDSLPDSTGTVGTSHQYAIDPTLDEMHSAGGTTTMEIAGISVPGVYDVVESGAGRKSQYLKETQAGANSGIDLSEYGGDNSDAAQDSSGDDSSSGGDLPPPKTVEVKAYVSGGTYQSLDALRTTPATEQLFDARVGDVALADCELVKLTRTLSGETPTVYDCTIAVREYREYEVVDNRSDYGGGGGSGGGGGGGSSGGGNTGRTPAGDYSTEVVRWTDRDGDGQVEGPEGQAPPEVRSAGGINESLSGGQAIENVQVNGNFSVTARGSGWAVRNVGVSQPYNGSDSGEPFAVEGDGIIEHCYFGEGSNSHDAAVFVHGNHTGDILIRYCYFANWGNGGIYGSDPGNDKLYPDTKPDGRVIVENCYFENNAIANLRLGSDGSGATGCVIHNPNSYGNRTLWGYFENTELTNCDLGGRIVVGENAYSKGKQASVVLNNCRWNGTGGTSIVGNSSISGLEDARSGTPNFSVPANVPTSASEAANGRYYSSPPGGN